MTCCLDRPEPSVFRPFDPAPFMERIHCGNWPDWLVGGWTVASIGLCLFYWCIAGLLLVMYFKTRQYRDRYPVRRLPWIAAFFVGCGGGHLMNFLAFFWPAYVLFVAWDWYTLVVSGVGVYAVYHKINWMINKITQLESGLHHVIDDKNEAVQKANTAEEQAAHLREQLQRKFELDFAQNERKRQELDAVRDELARLVNQQFTEEAYRNLRKRLHTIQGT